MNAAARSQAEASAAPLCSDCAHLQGKSTCTRPVPRFWNPATNQHRTHLSIGTAFERSNKKFFGRTRDKCGAEGVYFEPRGCPPIGAAAATPYSTIADSDGNDGA